MTATERIFLTKSTRLLHKYDGSGMIRHKTKVINFLSMYNAHNFCDGVALPLDIRENLGKYETNTHTYKALFNIITHN